MSFGVRTGMKVHNYVSVFFLPLAIVFILTGAPYLPGVHDTTTGGGRVVVWKKCLIDLGGHRCIPSDEEKVIGRQWIQERVIGVADMRTSMEGKPDHDLQGLRLGSRAFSMGRRASRLNKKGAGWQNSPRSR